MTDHNTENLASDAPASNGDGPLFGLMAEYDTVDDVVHAARQVRAAGFTRWDVHSPFPIHGIDHAMGIRPTILPWLVLVAGLAGLFGGVSLVYFINAETLDFLPTSLQGYEYLISGKPMFSLPANIAIIFETTVLLAAFGAVFGMLGLNKLPMLHHPLFNSPRFRRVTSDRFFVVIDASDPRFDAARTRQLLESTHPAVVEDVFDTADQSSGDAGEARS